MHIDYAHGQVAQTIHNYGGVSFNAGSSGPSVPSKHDRFLELAKEQMPIACHDQLDWLVKHSDLHAECLLLACKGKALICRNGRLERSMAWPHYSMGGLTIATLGGFAGYALLVWLAFNVNLPSTSQALLWCFISASAIGIWWIQRQFLYPQAVAKKAVAALAHAFKGKE